MAIVIDTGTGIDNRANGKLAIHIHDGARRHQHACINLGVLTHPRRWVHQWHQW